MQGLFGGFWDYWDNTKQVTFDGENKLVYVNPGVTELYIRQDLWSRWVDWQALPGSDKWHLAMRRTGYDLIPGGRSGDIYFMINGWRLVIDLNKTRVYGVLYSDDYDTAYVSPDLVPIYPAVVSAIVNTSIQTQVVQVQTPASEVANAILDSQIGTTRPTGSLGEFLVKKILTVAKFIGLK